MYRAQHRTFRLSMARVCIPISGVRMFNQLTGEVRIFSKLQQFRRVVKKWLKSNSLYSVKKFFDTFFPPTLKRYFSISLCSLNQHVHLVNIFKVWGVIKVLKPNHFHTAKFWFVTIVKYLETQPFGLVLNSNICLFNVYILLTPSESNKILSRSKNDCVSINNCVFRLTIILLCILQRLLKSPG